MSEAYLELLAKAWEDSWLRRYKAEYVSTDSQEDDRAWRIIAKQAEKRGWTLHSAIRFFDTALEVIEGDNYWNNRISPIAASKKINDVYVYIRKKTREESSRGDFKPEEFRKEMAKPSHREVARVEMKKIDQLLKEKGAKR